MKRKTSIKRVSQLAFALALVLSPAIAHAQTAEATAVAKSFVTEQPANEWLASLLIGQKVTNPNGETVGDINDLLVDQSGRITTAVLGVGGFLGIADKSVAVPFSSLSFSTGVKGERVVGVTLTKEALQEAPEFKPIEKSMFTKAKEGAGELGQRAMEKAGELKDKAVEKIEEMKKDDAKPK